MLRVDHTVYLPPHLRDGCRTPEYGQKCDPTPSEYTIAVTGENPKPLGKLVEATIADLIAELRINFLRASCDDGYDEVVLIIFERPHECALRLLLRRKTGHGIGDRMSHRLCIDDRPSGCIFLFDELVTQPGGNNLLARDLLSNIPEALAQANSQRTYVFDQGCVLDLLFDLPKVRHVRCPLLLSDEMVSVNRETIFWYSVFCKERKRLVRSK